MNPEHLGGESETSDVREAVNVVLSHDADGTNVSPADRNQGQNIRMRRTGAERLNVLIFTHTHTAVKYSIRNWSNKSVCPPTANLPSPLLLTDNQSGN